MGFPAVRVNIAWLSEIGLAFAAILLFAASGPAHAQNRDTDAELKALIPDAAVVDPEAWAKAHPPAADVRPEPELEPNSPMADDSQFRLHWPDEKFEVPALVTLEPDPDIAEALKAEAAAPALLRTEGNELRLSPQLALVFPADPAAMPMRRAFAERFAVLSTVRRLSGEGEDNTAQLAARARTDGDLLRRMLRIYGYYDGEVNQTINPGDHAAVSFDIAPGPRYRFGKIELGDLPTTGAGYPALRSAFGIQSGDPLDNDRIITSRSSLDVALGESGYAFAQLGEPELTADHLREEGDLALPVTTGGRYRFAEISSNLPKFLPAPHLQDIARFRPGDIYKRSGVEDLRKAIIATGLVSSVTVVPRKVQEPAGEAPGALALDIAMTKAPLRTIAGAIGYDSGEGFRLEASWEHRNLLPPEGLLRLRAVAGTKEQLGGITLRRNNFRGRDQVLTFDLYANSVKRDAYVAKTVAFSGTFEKLTTLVFQKPWVWSAGLEAVATNEREGDVRGVATDPQTYYVVALPLRGALDTSDDLLDPTHGFRAALRLSPEASFSQGRNTRYVRMQADASAYLPLGKSAVIAARMRLGSIPGAPIDDIAPSRRFYAGGGGSVRGFGYQEIGPRDALGVPSGGRSLSEFSLEARVKTGLFGGGLSLVPFIDAGTVDASSTPQFKGLRVGAGLGLRYQTGFGPIRLDIGMPLNRRPGESPVAVYVALGQAF